MLIIVGVKDQGQDLRKDKGEVEKQWEGESQLRKEKGYFLKGVRMKVDEG